MDLNNLDIVSLANEGSVLILVHPTTGDTLVDDTKKGTDKPKEWFLRLLGSDSDVYRSTMKRRFERTQGSKKKKIDLDEAQRKGAELLAKCTTECHMTENGKVIECTQAELVRIYLKYPFIREQAEEFMGDRSNLMTS